MDSASERIAIARALHDGFAQDLVALRYRVDFLVDSASIDKRGAYELNKISLEIARITEKVRRELFNLRESLPHSYVALDFDASIEKVTAPFRDQIQINAKSSQCSIPAHLFELFIYITPELLRNTLKHAGASRIDIALTELENSLQFSFSDDGIGGARESDLRYGLTGIRELVELNQGNFTIIDEGGTEICLNFPNKESLL